MSNAYNATEYLEHLNNGGGVCYRYFVYLNKEDENGYKEMVTYWADAPDCHNDVALRANSDNPDTFTFSVEREKKVS